MPGESLTKKSVSEEMKESSYLIVSQDEEINGELMQALRKIPVSVLSKHLGVDELKKIAALIPLEDSNVSRAIGFEDRIAASIINTSGEFETVDSEYAYCVHYTGLGAYVGKELLVSGACRQTAPLYVFKDIDGNVLDMGWGNGEETLTVVEKYSVIVPEHAEEIFVNQLCENSFTPCVVEPIKKLAIGEDDLSEELKIKISHTDSSENNSNKGNMELTEEFETVNLYNPNDPDVLIDYGFANSTATEGLQETSGYIVSGFIPVEVGRLLYWNNGWVANGANVNIQHLCFYDENKSYISGKKIMRPAKGYVVPEGAAYCRISILSTLTNFILNYDEIKPYEPYHEPITRVKEGYIEVELEKEEVTPEKTNFFAYKYSDVNLFNPKNADWEMQSFESGAFNNARKGYTTTDYIPVVAGNIYHLVSLLTNNTGYGWYASFYDSEKIYLSSNSSANASSGTKDITIPEGASYVKISIATSTDNGIRQEYNKQIMIWDYTMHGDIYSEVGFIPYGGIPYIPHNMLELLMNSPENVTSALTQRDMFSFNPLYSKTAVFFGDSIFIGVGSNAVGGLFLANDNYKTPFSSEAYYNYAPPARLIFENNPSMTIYNYAVGGGTFAQTEGNTFTDPDGVERNNWIATQVDQFIADYLAGNVPIPDYIIFEGGINDATRSLTLGELQEGYGDNVGNGVGSATYEPDLTSTIGGFEDVAKKLFTYFRSAKIGYCSSPPTRDYSYTKCESYFEAIYSACKKWGIPYFDTYHNVGSIYTANADGATDVYNVQLHPNYVFTRDRWSPKLESFMKTL